MLGPTSDSLGVMGGDFFQHGGVAWAGTVNVFGQAKICLAAVFAPDLAMAGVFAPDLAMAGVFDETQAFAAVFDETQAVAATIPECE